MRSPLRGATLRISPAAWVIHAHFSCNTEVYIISILNKENTIWHIEVYFQVYGEASSLSGVRCVR